MRKTILLALFTIISCVGCDLEKTYIVQLDYSDSSYGCEGKAKDEFYRFIRLNGIKIKDTPIPKVAWEVSQTTMEMALKIQKETFDECQKSQ